MGDFFLVLDLPLAEVALERNLPSTPLPHPDWKIQVFCLFLPCPAGNRKLELESWRMLGRDLGGGKVQSYRPGCYPTFQGFSTVRENEPGPAWFTPVPYGMQPAAWPEHKLFIMSSLFSCLSLISQRHKWVNLVTSEGHSVPNP